MAHDVFISHARQDKATADAVCATVEQLGIRCWIAPRDIRPGADWGSSLIRGLKGSRIMVLVLSRAANASPHILREVERAVHMGLPILPIRVEDVLPEGALEYHLGPVHWLDAVTPPFEAHLKRLAETLTSVLQHEGRYATAPVATVRPPGPPVGVALAPQPPSPSSPSDEAKSHSFGQAVQSGILWSAVRTALTAHSFMFTLLLVDALPFSPVPQGLSTENDFMFILGISFGPIVVLWRYPRIQDIDPLRGPVFIAVSLTTALLVFPTTALLVSKTVEHPVLATVGAIYLSLGHKFVLGASWRQVAGAVVGATAFSQLWVLTVGSGYLPAWFLSWQVGYLLGIFGVFDSAAERLRNWRSPTADDRQKWTRVQYAQLVALSAALTIALYALLVPFSSWQDTLRKERQAAKEAQAQAEVFKHAERAIRVPGDSVVKTSIGGFTLSSYEVLPEHMKVVYSSSDANSLEHTIARRDTEASARAHCLSFLPTWRDSEKRLTLEDLPIPLTDAEGQVVGSITHLHDAGGRVVGFTRRASGREELYWTNESYCLGISGSEGDAVRFQRLLGY